MEKDVEINLLQKYNSKSTFFNGIYECIVDDNFDAIHENQMVRILDSFPNALSVDEEEKIDFTQLEQKNFHKYIWALKLLFSKEHEVVIEYDFQKDFYFLTRDVQFLGIYDAAIHLQQIVLFRNESSGLFCIETNELFEVYVNLFVQGEIRFLYFPKSEYFVIWNYDMSYPVVFNSSQNAELIKEIVESGGLHLR